MTSRRYLALDHWRGLACLAVLVNHAVWYRTGGTGQEMLFDVAQRLWMGVPVFFVISGYCISAAVEAHRSSGTRPLRTYFTRRLRRIYPPYWILLGATLTLVALLDVLVPGAPLSTSGEFLRPWWYDGRQWFGNVTLTEIWRPHIIPGSKALMLGHAWTLCYEEQFYIVAGLLLWLAPQRYFLGAFLVSVVTAVVVLMVPPAAVDGFFFDGSWFQFWLGVVVFQVVRARQATRVAAVLFFLMIAAVAAADWPSLAQVEKNPTQAMFVASSFAAALVLLHRFDTDIAGMRFLRPIQLCGVMCYSLYLVHLPVVKLIRAGLTTFDVRPDPLGSLVLSAPICLVVAWWFHRTVERHFLNAGTPATLLPVTAPLSARPA